MKEASCKIAVSRSVVTWTQRALDCTSRPEYRDQLCSLLQGGSVISDRLLQYVFTDWESQMDVVRHSCELVFKGTVQLHQSCSTEGVNILSDE